MTDVVSAPQGAGANVSVPPIAPPDGDDDGPLSVGDSPTPPVPADGKIPAEKQDGHASRIDELTTEKYAERRRADLAEQRNRDLEQQLQLREEPKDKPAPKPRPKLADFGYDQEKYEDAVFEWSQDHFAGVARETVREELRAANEKRAEVRREATFEEREQEYASANPDYMELTRSEDLKISTVLKDVVTDSPIAPQIFHYLAKNKALAAQISQLPNLAVAREVGRIEARLENTGPATSPTSPAAAPVNALAPSAPPAPPLKVSSAPPPTPKVDAVAPVVSVDPNNMTDKQFAAWRRKFMK